MGYSHYFKRGNVDDVAYAKAVQEVARFLRTYAPWHRVDSHIEFGADEITVNGIGDDMGEELAIPCDAEDLGEHYCKTSRRPYDVLVTAVLTILAPSGIAIDSDGYPAEWQPGVDLAFKVLGTKYPNPMKPPTKYVIAREDIRNGGRTYFDPMGGTWRAGARKAAQKLELLNAKQAVIYLNDFAPKNDTYKIERA